MEYISTQHIRVREARVDDVFEFNGDDFIPRALVDVVNYKGNDMINLDLRHGDDQVIELPNHGKYVHLTCRTATKGRAINMLFKQGTNPVQVFFDTTVFQTSGGVLPTVTVEPNAMDMLSGVIMEDGKIMIFKVANLK